ncbi:MAG TPA: endonuclease/exonuclease/phosphatase family protein [Sunxiuqinia sp.]|nr:endonuclease/exonuclease/phosphatase family protein [Sunxiuqinia sp.]
MKKFFRNIFLLFNLIAVFGLLGSYLAEKISPADWWVPAFFGLAYPYLLLINIIFILFWLFVKTRLALISFLAIVVGYGNLYHYFQLTDKQTDKKGITLCSYNVKNFYGADHLKRAEAAEKILDYLMSKNPDIICIQEVYLKGQKSFTNKSGKNRLPDKTHLKYIHASKVGGQVTYSSYPIIHKDEVHFPNSGNMFIVSDLKIGKDTVRLFNCHLESYRFTDTDISKLDDISLDQQVQSYKQVRYTGSKLKRAFVKRTKQAEALHQRISTSPYPVIVCGDFNDTPVSYTYHTVRDDLDDAFVESGKGIGNTYRGRLPSFRIDYILHSSIFEGYNFHVDKVNYSDHYPIHCVLIRRKDQ